MIIIAKANNERKERRKFFWASLLASFSPLIVGMGLGAYFFVVFRPIFGEVIIIGLLLMFPLLIYRYRRSDLRARRLARKEQNRKGKPKRKLPKRKKRR